MAQIGSLPASGTEVFNLDFLPEYLLVADTANNEQDMANLSVVTSGTQLVSITDVSRIDALAKFDSGAILQYTSGTTSRTASYLKLAVGRINKATTITATNNSAGIRAVFAASTSINNIARRAVEQSINPSANATFTNFEALFFLQTNVLRAQVTFDNGFTDEFTPAELEALYAKYHVSDNGGNLAGLTCIDANSGAGNIVQVVLFNGSGGSTVVLKTDYVEL